MRQRSDKEKKKQEGWGSDGRGMRGRASRWDDMRSSGGKEKKNLEGFNNIEP